MHISFSRNNVANPPISVFNEDLHFLSIVKTGVKTGRHVN